jgi:uncharacterized protein (TIGR02246 family)
LRADEDDERQIRELIEAWIAASNARNLPALMDMMTDDVVFMTPGRAPFGKAEFAADVGRMKSVAIDARVEVQEIEVFGPRAYIRNHIRVELTSPGQASKRVSGYAMSVLRAGASPATPTWLCPNKREFAARTGRQRRRY